MRLGVCALTGLQLLCLVLESRDHPERKQEFRKQLFSQKGVLEPLSDYSLYLTVPSSNPDC